MKKRFIIMLLSSVILFTGCGSKVEKEETKTEYFNFTPTELITELEECLIDVTPMGDFETEDKTARVAAYASTTDVFQTDSENVSSQIHYQITYDDITDKASYISFFLSKDATKAHERYLYHIFSIASFIDGNINTDNLSDAISAGLSENDFAIFTGEKFKLHVTSSEEYLDASFTAIKN